MASNGMIGSAASVPDLAMHDVHKSTQEAKRDSDYFHKWKHGSRLPATEGAKPHPVVLQTHTGRRNKGKYSSHGPARDKAFAHRHPTLALDPGHDFPHGVLHSASVTSVSSGDEMGVIDGTRGARGSPHGEPDAGIAYSFDHTTGPSDGSNVLTQALGRAVARFEDKQTRKLVRDEYDVVTSDEDDENIAHGPQVEDDFEILGHFES